MSSRFEHSRVALDRFVGFDAADIPAGIEPPTRRTHASALVQKTDPAVRLCRNVGGWGRARPLAAFNGEGGIEWADSGRSMAHRPLLEAGDDRRCRLPSAGGTFPSFILCVLCGFITTSAAVDVRS
jgi:hypothetical protein